MYTEGPGRGGGGRCPQRWSGVHQGEGVPRTCWKECSVPTEPCHSPLEPLLCWRGPLTGPNVTETAKQSRRRRSLERNCKGTLTWGLHPGLGGHRLGGRGGLGLLVFCTPSFLKRRESPGETVQCPPSAQARTGPQTPSLRLQSTGCHRCWVTSVGPGPLHAKSL